MNDQDWAVFVEAASISIIDPTTVEEANREPINPYVLAQSAAQQDFHSVTEEIYATVKSEFTTATWVEVKDFFLTLVKSANTAATEIIPQYFLILDEQSLKDHKVLFVEHDYECVDAEGYVRDEPADPATLKANALTKIDIWRKHRVPYDQIAEILCVFEAKGGWTSEKYENEFLEEVVRDPDTKDTKEYSDR
jgi:hypothetical protein